MIRCKRTWSAAWLTLCALVLAALAQAPAAAAHSCKSYDESECDPNGCVEGQEHYHKHLRYWWEGDDEYCQTEGKEEPEKEPNPEKEKCIIADKEFPKGVCDLINDPSLAETLAPVLSLVEPGPPGAPQAQVREGDLAPSLVHAS